MIRFLDVAAPEVNEVTSNPINMFLIIGLLAVLIAIIIFVIIKTRKKEK